jgi:hypothetical protein
VPSLAVGAGVRPLAASRYHWPREQPQIVHGLAVASGRVVSLGIDVVVMVTSLNLAANLISRRTVRALLAEMPGF